MDPFQPMPEKSSCRSPLLVFLKQLMGDVAAWSNDELALTRLDAMSVLRPYMIALGLIFVSFAILIAAVFTMSETTVGSLACCFSCLSFYISARKRNS